MKAGTIPLYQLWAAVLMILAGKALETLPRALALGTTTAAPWAVLVTGAAAFLLFWPVAAALARRPGSGLVQLALEAGGRPLAIGVALSLSAFLLAGAGLSLRQASEMAVTAIYPHTPQTFAMSTIALVAALAAAMQPPNLVWLGMLWLWPTLAGFAVVLVGNISWGQLRNALPLAGPGILPVTVQVLPLTSHFGEMVFLAVFSSYLAEPARLARAALYVALGAALTWAVVELVYLMVFPLPGGLAVPFPLFEMTQLVQGGRFFERVDAFWVTFWIAGAAGRGAAALHVSALLLRDAFRLPDHRGAVLPLGIAMVSLALFPANQADAIAAEAFLLRRWGFLVLLVMPLGVALLARLRGPRAGAEARGGHRA